MSDGPFAVNIVRHTEGHTVLETTSTYDTREAALRAVDTLLDFWTFAADDERTIEVERA